MNSCHDHSNSLYRAFCPFCEMPGLNEQALFLLYDGIHIYIRKYTQHRLTGIKDVIILILRERKSTVRVLTVLSHGIFKQHLPYISDNKIKK